MEEKCGNMCSNSIHLFRPDNPRSLSWENNCRWAHRFMCKFNHYSKFKFILTFKFTANDGRINYDNPLSYNVIKIIYLKTFNDRQFF